MVRWGRGRAATLARLAVIVVPMLAALTLRTYQAFSERGVLDWDETYYLSTAVTGADGRGLYPYVFGYGPMPILGGLGYAAYLYAVVVKIFGPSILALRAVSLLAALAGLVCLWLVVRRWYGSGAAWMAATLAAASRLFAMSNSIRLDSLAFAWVAAGGGSVTSTRG